MVQIHLEAKDIHHGRTSIVRLNSTLVELVFLFKGVPTKLNGTIAEFTNKIASLSAIVRVLHHHNLKEYNEYGKLEEALLGGGVSARDGFQDIGGGFKGVNTVVNISRKENAVAGNDMYQEGKMRNAAVIDIRIQKAIEALLI